MPSSTSSTTSGSTTSTSSTTTTSASSGSTSTSSSNTGSTTTASGSTSSSSSSQSSTFIFVRNAQSGVGLQELRLNADGSIQPVSGSPFAYNAQTLGIAGNYLIAGTGTTMAAYSVNASTGALMKTSSDVPGGQVAGNSNFVYAGTTDAIYGYSLTKGELVALSGSPFQVQPVPACGCATPSYGSVQIAQGYLFFADSADHAGSGLAAGKIQGDGSFTAAGFGGGSSSAASLLAAPNGKFIYESASGLSTLELFDFNPSTGIAQDMGPTVAENGGVIDPSSTFLFATDSGNSGIQTYRIDPQTGALTLVATAQDPDATPEAVDPSGKYLLTLESPTQTTYAIGVWSIDMSSGALTSVGSYPLGSFSNTYAPDRLVVGSFQ